MVTKRRALTVHDHIRIHVAVSCCWPYFISEPSKRRVMSDREPSVHRGAATGTMIDTFDIAIVSIGPDSCGVEGRLGVGGCL